MSPATPPFSLPPTPSGRFLSVVVRIHHGQPASLNPLRSQRLVPNPYPLTPFPSTSCAHFAQTGRAKSLITTFMFNGFRTLAKTTGDSIATFGQKRRLLSFSQALAPAISVGDVPANSLFINTLHTISRDGFSQPLSFQLLLHSFPSHGGVGVSRENVNFSRPCEKRFGAIWRSTRGQNRSLPAQKAGRTPLDGLAQESPEWNSMFL